MILNLLSVAGSDSGGGAGIQADLKAFSALGAYGMSVLTALTAQNTRGVHAVHAVPADFVRAQLDAVASDIRIDALKLGMLANADIVHTVADWLAQWPTNRRPVVVLDTVMVAKGGHALLAPDAVAALRRRLLPLADLITPNLPEAAALLDQPVAADENDMQAQAAALGALGARGVLLKGGHLSGPESPDWLWLSQTGGIRLSQPRIATTHTHGTGCTLSAALATLRLRHGDWEQTVVAAQRYLQGALRGADQLEVGGGIGPLHHFFAWWD